MTMKMNKTQWKEVKHLAKEAGIEYMQWYERCVVHGKDPVWAATTPLQKQVKTYTIDGYTMSTAEHCKRKGLNLQTVKSRMRKNDMTFEQALRYPTDTAMSRSKK